MKKKLTWLFLSLIILAGVAFLCQSCGSTEQKKNYLIGVINPNKGTTNFSVGFIEGLTEYGYVEGKNTTYVISEDSAETDKTINDLVARKADLIFTVTTPAARKAKKATKGINIPVVFVLYDPVSADLIDSLSSPGGNLTGIQMRGSIPKAYDWLMTLMPGIKHLYVPVKFDTPAAKQSLAVLKKAAMQDVAVTVMEMSTLEDIEGAFVNMPGDADAIFLLHSIFISTNAKAIVDQAIKRKLPVGSGTSLHKDGVTIAYGVKWRHTGKQAARLAQLVLRGGKAGEIPAEISDFFLGVNLKTAQASGIEVSSEILLRADEIVR